MDKLSSLLVVLVSGVLAGCLPIAPAHKTVQVPILEVQLHGTPQATDGLQIIRPRYESDLETFLAIVKGAPGERAERYALAGANGNVTTVNFAAESRYVGVPAISFLPEAPAYGQEHVFFLRLGPADDALYRLTVEGRKARVDKTSLSAARQRWSPALDQPQPSNRDPHALALRQKWNQPREDFYRASSWSASDRVAIESFRRGGERDVLSLRIR